MIFKNNIRAQRVFNVSAALAVFTIILALASIV